MWVRELTSHVEVAERFSILRAIRYPESTYHSHHPFPADIERWPSVDTGTISSCTVDDVTLRCPQYEAALAQAKRGSERSSRGRHWWKSARTQARYTTRPIAVARVSSTRARRTRRSRSRNCIVPGTRKEWIVALICVGIICSGALTIVFHFVAK